MQRQEPAPGLVPGKELATGQIAKTLLLGSRVRIVNCWERNDCEEAEFAAQHRQKCFNELVGCLLSFISADA